MPNTHEPETGARIVRPRRRTNERPFPRTGAWGVVDGRVGIVAALDDTSAEFHVVDTAGDTTLVTSVALAALRQAKLSEIPEARRPIAEHGATLGYVE